MSRKIDLRIVEKLFEITTTPNDMTKDEVYLFYNHPTNGVMIGKPFLFFDKKEYDHQWYRFKPSTSIEDTKFLMDHLSKRGIRIKIFSVFNDVHDDSLDIRWLAKIYDETEDPSRVEQFYGHENFEMAVCNAILKENLENAI